MFNYDMVNSINYSNQHLKGMEKMKIKKTKYLIRFRISFFPHQTMPKVTMIKTNSGTTMATTMLAYTPSLLERVNVLFWVLWYSPWVWIFINNLFQEHGLALIHAYMCGVFFCMASKHLHQRMIKNVNVNCLPYT